MVGMVKALDGKIMTETSELHHLPPIGPVAALNDRQREALARVGRFEELPVGDYIAVQGQPHRSMSLLLSGRVAVSVDAHGDHVDLAMLEAGDVVGEMSMIDPQRASATARVAAGPARIWVIDGSAFDWFVAMEPTAGFVLMRELGKVLCRRVRHASDQMLSRAAELRAHFLDMDY